ncbi:hypothetical protein HKX48_006802 [Thoreauomyces humboldtii]|nr:hypothetical protein HKX48_006802 [Thoreauomyces humboldtii]
MTIKGTKKRLRHRRPMVLISTVVIVGCLLAVWHHGASSHVHPHLIGFSETSPQKQYAVIASEENPMYSFFIPLTAMVWARYVGFTPIVFLIDDDSTKDGAPGVAPSDAGPSGRFFPIVEKLLRDQNIGIVRHLKPNSSLPANGQVLSQSSRLMASLLPELDVHAYVLTSDVDLWPLAQRPYWTNEVQQERFNVSGKDISLYNALCCGHGNVAGIEYREYPMSCIGMAVETWKQVLGVQSVGSHKQTTAQVQDAVVQGTNDLLTRHLGYGTSSALVLPEKGVLTRWYYDQILVSYLLALPGEHTGRLLEIPRDTLSDRMDRIAWPADVSGETLPNFVDAHLLRPGYEDKNWPRLRNLLALLLSEADMSVVDKYLEDFRKAMKSQI